MTRCAQRRPELKPRRHPQSRHLRPRSGGCAQRRPELKPRRHQIHVAPVDGADLHGRSTKAGAQAPATPVPAEPGAGCFVRSTKAGAQAPATLDGDPADSARGASRSTKAGAQAPATRSCVRLRSAQVGGAQRRPELKPRRHIPGRHGDALATLRSTKAGAQAPATHGEYLGQLGDMVIAQRRPELKPRRHVSVHAPPSRL